MRVVVTGGAGFIGSVFLGELNKAGIDDIIVVDNLGMSEKWKNLRKKSFSDYIDKKDFIDKLRNGDSYFGNLYAIVHLGACSSTTETDASYLMGNNYGYTKELALYAVKNNVRFIYASSAATYGDGSLGYSDSDEKTPVLLPLNMYGFSKHLFDLWVLRNSFQNGFCGLKFFNVFGPNEYHKGSMRSMVHKGYEQIIRDGKIRLFKSYRPEYKDGEQKRDFIYVKDAVSIIKYFFDNPGKNGIVNVGTGTAASWNRLASAIFSALGLHPNIEYIDMPEELRGKYQYYTKADIGKLRELGYKNDFYLLEDAVADYVSVLKGDVYL